MRCPFCQNAQIAQAGPEDVPGLSDDEAQVDAMAGWLASLDRSIPYHLTRFFPRHRMADVPPTPKATLRRLRAVAARHLDDVMLGNV